jgi:hypothetical protein
MLLVRAGAGEGEVIIHSGAAGRMLGQSANCQAPAIASMKKATVVSDFLWFSSN